MSSSTGSAYEAAGDQTFDIPAVDMPLPVLAQTIDFVTADDPMAVGCAGPTDQDTDGNGSSSSKRDGSCGLEIDAWPTVDGHFGGSFSGALLSSSSTPVMKSFQATFDVVVP